MPYRIEQQGNKFAVINSRTRKVMGRHPSRSKARAQLAALYANEPEAEKGWVTLDDGRHVLIGDDAATPPKNSIGNYVAHGNVTFAKPGLAKEYNRVSRRLSKEQATRFLGASTGMPRAQYQAK